MPIVSVLFDPVGSNTVIVAFASAAEPAPESRRAAQTPSATRANKTAVNFVGAFDASS
ncbi:MAG: hypothetical protein ABSD74_12800 [Rhizomicrobium sp.]|jgi:hypothetical protein